MPESRRSVRPSNTKERPLILAVCLSAMFAVEAGTATSSSVAAAAPASPTATPAPRLKLDIERHVEEMLEKDLPHFRAEVTVVKPQEALQHMLEGFDPLCGPRDMGGAPTVTDMGPYRPHLTTPLFSVDVLKLIADFKKSGPDRFFLYRVSRADGVTYAVYDHRLPWDQLLLPGVVLEPIAAFPDRATATHAWWRLMRGFATAEARPVPPCGAGR